MRIAIDEQAAAEAGVIPFEPHGPQYAEFIVKCLTALAGYEFHHPAARRNVPPPTVPFMRPLRWWSRDRPQRLMEVRKLRDEFIQAILACGGGPANKAPDSRSAATMAAVRSGQPALPIIQPALNRTEPR
jgi:hypothetical protein